MSGDSPEDDRVSGRPRRRTSRVPAPRAKYLGGTGPRQPEPIADVLGSVFERLARADRRTVELVEQWKEIAGADWLEAKPVGLRNGVLTVEVPSGSAASLLRFRVPDLLAAIAARFAPDMVAAVRLRVADR